MFLDRRCSFRYLPDSLGLFSHNLNRGYMRFEISSIRFSLIIVAGVHLVTYFKTRLTMLDNEEMVDFRLNKNGKGGGEFR